MSRRTPDKSNTPKINTGFPVWAGIILILALIIVTIIAIVVFVALQNSISEQRQSICPEIADVPDDAPDEV